MEINIFWQPILPHSDSNNFLHSSTFTGGPDPVSTRLQALGWAGNTAVIQYPT